MSPLYTVLNCYVFLHLYLLGSTARQLETAKRLFLSRVRPRSRASYREHCYTLTHHRRQLVNWFCVCMTDYPLFLDCHAIGNDLPVDRDELGSVQLNRTCGHSSSAWCQLGNGLRIMNGGSGQWKRLRSRMGHALDDDDDDDGRLDENNFSNQNALLRLINAFSAE